jgi:hypothetical protein
MTGRPQCPFCPNFALDSLHWVRTAEDADHHLQLIRDNAAHTQSWLASETADPIDLFRKMKFGPHGRHPVEGHNLNIVEQINQTWTYATAFLAARQLLTLLPEALGLKLAPGAHKSLEFDIMSEKDGYLIAETFATVDPSNNRKLKDDLKKLSDREEPHRYIFFMSPKHPGTQRLPGLDKHGVQVWSIDTIAVDTP